MSIDNLIDFENLISKNDAFSGVVFNLENYELKIRSFKSQWITFNNCIFNCNKLSIINIYKNDLNLEFNNCTFNCELNFYNCKIDSVRFLNTKKIKSLNLNGFSKDLKFEINKFSFKNDYSKSNEEVISNFNFNNVFFEEYFEFIQINQVKGVFVFHNNKVGVPEENKGSCVFLSSQLSNASFDNNEFLNYTNFKSAKFSFDLENFKNSGSYFNKSKFSNNVFYKLNFSEVELKCKVEFDKCDFLETTWFENCIRNNENELRIIACKFEKYTLFDNSFFNKIEILHSKFKEKVSFENFNVNVFKIHQVSFLDSAYFDDLNKNNSSAIQNWERKTLRAIKRELVNTHNQIDYLKFKAYELEAYKKEKGKTWKDSFILNLNSFSSSNGLDWVKALRFIFLTSFINYLFYLITYLISVKGDISERFPNTIEEFFVNYLKFINPLMFLKSPIEDAENYFFPLLFLLLGKILISYGIYQLIQAFRKFGKNGD